MTIYKNQNSVTVEKQLLKHFCEVDHSIHMSQVNWSREIEGDCVSLEVFWTID